MNKTEERKHRKTLTWTVLLYVLGILILSELFSYAFVSLILHFGLLPVNTNAAVGQQIIMLLLIGISLVIGFLLISLTSRVSLTYINKFINQMNRLAAGDFKARLSYQGIVSRHPTIREIEGSFNNLADELENMQMLKTEFINNFSHEFKTPIVSVAGFAKLLKHGKLSEEQRAEYLNIIEEEALRLSAMATNVLNMTKVENQVILTDITSFNLSEQIRSSVLLLENAWTKKKIELNLEFEEYQIAANEELLKQVWINLLDNAIKFSPEYGLIEVKISDTGADYRVSIANAGEEIPTKSREKIFLKFYQADESHAQEGNGIGLAIVKKVATLHKGHVEVTCRNGITTFVVTIPKGETIQEMEVRE